MIDVGSHIRITIGTRQVYGRVLRVWNKPLDEGMVAFDPKYPNEYWDMEYEIDNPAPGRGPIGRWKQSVDGGYVQLS